MNSMGARRSKLVVGRVSIDAQPSLAIGRARGCARASVSCPCRFPVHLGGPSEARLYRSRALLLCYAPPRDPMAEDALAAFAGDKLVHVGEHEGETSTRYAFHPVPFRPLPPAAARGEYLVPLFMLRPVPPARRCAGRRGGCDWPQPHLRRDRGLELTLATSGLGARDAGGYCEYSPRGALSAPSRCPSIEAGRRGLLPGSLSGC